MQRSYTEAEHGLLIALQDNRKEGIDGLENRNKSGRPSKLSDKVAVKVMKKLKERKQGWTLPKDFTAASLDESFFLFDSLKGGFGSIKTLDL